MCESDPLFPRTFVGRLRLAAESLFLLCVGAYAVLNWPPVAVAAQGVWADIFLAIVFEMMVAIIPAGILGLWWAVATPEWIRRMVKQASDHALIPVLALIALGLLGMIAAALGWW